ncbi:hypothetical protein MOHU_16470 [Moorella humiferrea]|uniref:Uncharacterized protein n=1 Tax=Neomoorella humiferrea TaxID=676965 RepID=A0A2T0AQG8_9FIRM|nr:hypothetical protein MOHU_16470 [Moorella humiferrea]
MEGRVVFIYYYLGYHRYGLPLDTPPLEFIHQGLLDHVAYGALGVGDGKFQGDRRQFPCRQFRPPD